MVATGKVPPLARSATISKPAQENNYLDASREAPFLLNLMSALIFFIRQIPNLLGTSSHMPWNHRLKLFRPSYAFYVNQERKEKERKALPSMGQPSLRPKCCVLIRERFEAERMFKDIPELAGILRLKGSALYHNT